MKKDSLGFIMVCNIGGQLGTKVVILALGMLAIYMRFNGTGIWGGETMCVQGIEAGLGLYIIIFLLLNRNKKYSNCV